MKPTQGNVGSSELSDIIAKLDFPSLVSETHTIIAHKTLCPFHQDSSPSCQIYPDGFKCFACGASGDALDWLERVHNLSKTDAIKALENRVGVITTAHQKPVRKPKALVKQCDAKPLSDSLHIQFWQRLEKLETVPKALESRSFTIDDCKALGIASSGNNAVIAITDPLGSIVAFKQRFYTINEGQQRYFYLTKDVGTPAWCSLMFFTSEKVMIIEGELNAMAACLSRRNGDPDMAFMGIAGVNGQLWLDALKDKTVYIYGDGDPPGQEARERWALAAYEAGAKKVLLLDPLPDLKDFCDIAGQQGRDALRELLPC